MKELIIQPKMGTLTRISEPFEKKIYAMCICGSVLRICQYEWQDGVRRPQTCKRCSIKKRRRFCIPPKREPVAAVGKR